MSIELVQSLWKAWSRGDMASVFGKMSDEITWIIPELAPWGGVYHGHAGITDYMHNASRHLADDSARYDVFLERAGYVVDIGSWQATIVSTGKSFVCPTVHVVKVGDGDTVTEVRSYYDPSELLVALAP